MKALSKEGKEEQSKYELSQIISKNDMFELIFKKDEVVGVLTEAYYYEVEENGEENKDCYDITLQQLKDQIDDRIIYEGNGRFLVVEHGESVIFEDLGPSEKASVICYLREKLETYSDRLEADYV